jgi:predicted transcriptional regulator/DNA-binding XRE family transcriptional regulator
MRKTFLGVRLRRLREEKGLTQAALAKALSLSSSYVNQLEQNQRPLTVPILLKINAVFGVDVQLFSEDEEARLIAELRDVLSESAAADGHVTLAEMRELVAGMPALARAFIALHRRYRDAAERADALAARFGEGDGLAAAQMPFEEVRDFFYARRNYIDALDRAAERVFGETGGTIGEMSGALVDRFRTKHDIEVTPGRADGAAAPIQRHYDARARRLVIGRNLRPGQQAFQLATQLAFIECGETIDRLTAEAAFVHPETRGLARIGLANYFAGALILPYGPFLSAAESLRYDIDQLARRFGVGFETVCHRLSTLQRSNARGVPFFFVRIDRAGNMSKRQSATDFHFSRVGGTCPLWNVYDAFAQPGRVLVQLAEMPDGRTYLCVARTVTSGQGGYGTPNKTFAIALGCDLRYASRLVYSKGLDLKSRDARTPIGVGCKLCEREACPQRAFPAIGRPLTIDEASSRFAPYSVA